MIRQRIIFHGEVQGVGFRWTTCNIAVQFQVVGTVQNMPNRTVELIVQGTAETVSAMREEISAHFAGKITETVVEQLVTDSALSNFQILR
jgi:acylphosphatase